MTHPDIDARAQLQTALGDAYTVERQLGRGGMATVWLVLDRKHKRPVALKVLHPNLAASLGADRFVREIEVVARLHHPHILPVHDSGNANGVLWFSMPYVDGETLRARLDREGQLSVEEAIRITREASQALQYAHDRGIVHRDIKPENLLLTTDGNTLVADFGIAQAFGADTASGEERITESGQVVGTLQYMSPEQASGERTLDARTDMYALATVLYEMLAGEPPFTGPNAQTVRSKMLTGPPPSVRRARPAIAPILDAAIDKALSPVPADRYNSMSEFAQALVATEGTAQRAASPLVAEHKNKFGRRLLVATFAIAAVLIAGGIFLWSRGRTPAPVADAAVAVLPFENEGDTSSEYFADGITDEIRGKLTALPALRVIARASSNQYRGSGKSPQQIARELGATYLLTGVVRWETSPTHARRVRVSPELVQLSREGSPRTIWQQTYDTTLADVFQVQTSVAGKVAASLGVVLSSPAQAHLAQKPTDNLAAYQAYLRSTAFDATDLPTLRRSLADAEQAVALDSNFAAAWARTGRLHAAIYSNGNQLPADSEAARSATERAIALDSENYQGYVARGVYFSVVASDQVRALADLERALVLAPSSAEVLRTLALVEASAGKWDAALAHVRKASVLDPRSASVADRLSRMYLWLRRYPEARAAAEKGLAVNGGYMALIEDRALSFVGQGDLPAARASLHKVPIGVDRNAVLAYVTNYWDTFWILDSADAAVARALPVAAFDGDRSVWGTVRSELFLQGRDSARARVYADSAQLAYDQMLRQDSTNSQAILFRAIMHAYRGERKEAIRDRDRGLAFALKTEDQWSVVPYSRHVAARVDVELGDRDAAISELREILAKPYVISAAWLRVDPTWNALRGDPRFEALAHGDGR